MEVFLTRGDRLSLTDVGHTSHARVTGLRISRDAQGGSLTLTLVEGLQRRERMREKSESIYRRATLYVDWSSHSLSEENKFVSSSNLQVSLEVVR